jgi:inner membrane protein
MNRSVHALAGALIAGVGYAALCRSIEQKPQMPQLFAYAAAGAAVGCLHDLLEPAIHPQHRGLVHSLVLSAVVAGGVHHVWRRTDLPSDQKVLWAALGLAWLSHPLLDATPPRGLPLL